MLEAVSNDGGGLLRGDKYHRKKACQDITFPLKIELNGASNQSQNKIMSLAAKVPESNEKSSF
jgi:hypothetical protein